MKSISKDLTGASAAAIVLCAISNNDNYGYEIVQKVKKISNGEITWKEASIYPVLKKLETGGMIKSYWKMQENERPRRYYTILSAGKKQLEIYLHEWELVYSVINKLKKTNEDH